MPLYQHSDRDIVETHAALFCVNGCSGCHHSVNVMLQCITLPIEGSVLVLVLVLLPSPTRKQLIRPAC